MTRPYRLLKVGPADDPGVVYVISPDDGRLWMTDGSFAQVIATHRALEDLCSADLPAWLHAQGHSLTLTPVECVSAADLKRLSEALMEAAHGAYSEPRRHASAVTAPSTRRLQPAVTAD